MGKGFVIDGDTLIENPENTKPPVRELWVVVSRDTKSGSEAICAARVGDMGMQPLVARNHFQLENFVLPNAKRMMASMRLTGKSLHLLHFTNPAEEKFPW